LAWHQKWFEIVSDELKKGRDTVFSRISIGLPSGFARAPGAVFTFKANKPADFWRRSAKMSMPKKPEREGLKRLCPAGAGKEAVKQGKSCLKTLLFHRVHGIIHGGHRRAGLVRWPNDR
jgi:hypothetical protein